MAFCFFASLFHKLFRIIIHHSRSLRRSRSFPRMLLKLVLYTRVWRLYICVSYQVYKVYAYQFWGVLFPGILFHSKIAGACPVTADLILRVNVRAATTTTTVFAALS